MKTIDTNKFSQHLREKSIDKKRKAILLTNFTGSSQENDLSEPANCNGFGRIRHFRLNVGENWPQNPLPILPAAKALGISPISEIRAQVFQSSGCNWRCWYCFVDDKLLNADNRHASFLTCEEMVDLYLDQSNPPSMIDLTGGQPDLTPEWVPWMMETLIGKGLDNKIYLWSDDNLSNDYLWQYLSPAELDLLANYKMYSRVCCFKGIDQNSFSLNTKASPQLFYNQFELCKRLIEINIDLYCYVTLTATSDTNIESAIPKFLDSVQKIHELLPLRIAPLKIFEFTPVKARMNNVYSNMLEGQNQAIQLWTQELTKRFSPQLLNTPVTEIKIRNRI